MIGIIISIVILICVIVVVMSISHEIAECMFWVSITAIVLLAVTPLIIMPFTGGLSKNYGTINQIGYLTNFSERGVIYKTHEGELQKGVGEQATAEKAFAFSISIILAHGLSE